VGISRYGCRKPGHAVLEFAREVVIWSFRRGTAEGEYKGQNPELAAFLVLIRVFQNHVRERTKVRKVANKSTVCLIGSPLEQGCSLILYGLIIKTHERESSYLAVSLKRVYLWKN